MNKKQHIYKKIKHNNIFDNISYINTVLHLLVTYSTAGKSYVKITDLCITTQGELY